MAPTKAEMPPPGRRQTCRDREALPLSAARPHWQRPQGRTPPPQCKRRAQAAIIQLRFSKGLWAARHRGRDTIKQSSQEGPVRRGACLWVCYSSPRLRALTAWSVRNARNRLGVIPRDTLASRDAKRERRTRRGDGMCNRACISHLARELALPASTHRVHHLSLADLVARGS